MVSGTPGRPCAVGMRTRSAQVAEVEAAIERRDVLRSWSMRGTAHGNIPISTYNGMLFATVVVDGQVAGTWKRRLRSTQVDMDARVVPAVDRSAVEAAAQRLGTFHDLPVRVTFGEPLELTRPGPTWGARSAKAWVVG